MDNNGRGDHEQRVDDVVRGDDARQVAALRTLLDESVERDAIEAAERAEQHDVGQYAYATRSGDELTDRRYGGRRRDGLRKVEIDCEHAEPDRAERHKAKFDAVTPKGVHRAGTRRQRLPQMPPAMPS